MFRSHNVDKKKKKPELSPLQEQRVLLTTGSSPFPPFGTLTLSSHHFDVVTEMGGTHLERGVADWTARSPGC